MNVMNVEWHDRLQHWTRTLRDDFYEPLGEITWTAFKTMEHLTAEEALDNVFEPIEPGFSWGKQWEYCWFKSRITLPPAAEGQRIVMDLKPGGESTLFVNGQAFGTYRSDWVSIAHHYIEDNVLCRCGKAGETFDVLMETYAGHYYPEAPGGGCATGPVLPGAYQDPEKEGNRRTLGICTYGIWNEEAYQLFMDVDTLEKLLRTLDPASLRASKIAEALERFTVLTDFEQKREDRTASYREAEKALKDVLEAQNGSTMPVFYAVGNAHLDMAWLWPTAETCRKTARTFAQQLRLIEEYPEYKFIQSQPASYEMCRKFYPEIYKKIKEAVKKGQWIADGAMWVEPDTNMAGGEALIRQILYGRRYYQEEFGVESKVLWLPDTFGYTAALPQILKSCGVEYLVTQKIFWSYNEGEQFPYHYFNWAGMDGTKIVSFLPASYTYRTDPEEVNNVWKKRVQIRNLDAFLLPCGYGDGGGGPSRDYIEYVRRQKDLEGGVKMKFASPMEFFEDMEKSGGPVNTYTGELYFSAHRGTYTSQAEVKKNNRKCELQLREMDLWGAAASLLGKKYDHVKAEELWKKLLFNQFHDILPGSSIARVYEEAEKEVTKVIKESKEITQKILQEMTDTSGQNNEAVTIFNSLSFDRNVLVSLPDHFADGARTIEGEAVVTAYTPEGVKAVVHCPSCGAVSLMPAKIKEKEICGKASVLRCGEVYQIENEKVSAKVNKHGEIVSFILKSSGREFAAAPMNRFHLYKDVPRLFDAWDIDSNYREQEVEDAVEAEIEIVSEGIEAVLKVTGKISHSYFVQYIRLEAGSSRLVFETEADWRELHRLWKTAFPVEVYAENGINEIQFGYVERPVHRSRPYDQDRFEVCNHRYSALCDGGHGAAVLNDSKYGISMNGNALELTLLRASASPEMRADNRVHHFTYAFTAWEGSFTQSDVVRQGYELNVKPQVISGKSSAFSMLQIDRPNVILETVKPAEDGSGDMVLRLYEAQKASGNAKISLDLEDCRVYLCNMLENILEEIPVKKGEIELFFKAFEIKTIRISR